QLANDFRKKYRILFFPLINPDGVDLGHWRHNGGGIDLNRDWAYYRQPEVRQTADQIVSMVKKAKSKVILGLDFHSTYKDIYYSNSLAPDQIHHFKDYWLQGIEEALVAFDYQTKEAPSGLRAPVSKGWFYQQFKAEALTYEIGDSTPRDMIMLKGRISALEMMQLLIFR
ncbi:MAG: M14 family zinc carboxypeptidase, partial [Bacteroidota bacterium]